jgi:hypothetical protein
MTSRKKLIFKVNNQIVMEDRRDLYPNQIDELKWFVAKECSCHYEDVEVDIVENTLELSEMDIDNIGLFDWKSLDCIYLSGLSLSIVEGSDEYLEALTNGTLEDFVIFV